MSATVGAALKKIAVALLTDKRVLKTLGGIVLGILIIIIMPIVAVISVFNGTIELDTDALQQQIVAQMTAEQKEELQFIEDTMNAIETEMTKAGFPERVKEAQVLFVLALSDYAREPDFVTKLVSCFVKDQTDEQLIARVNETFGTELDAGEFSQVMAGIRSTTIDTSNFTNAEGKNNLDLVKWVIQAEKAGWGYVWGTSGEVLTKKAYEAQKKLYPSEVGGYADFIEKNWLGKRTADCSGLIRSYHWLNPKTGKIENGSNGIPAMTADGMYQAAKEKGSISSIPEIPGLAVWHSGHIGVYIGNGEVIEAMGTKYGVVRTKLAARGWTHWLKIPYIDYEKEKGGKKEDKKKKNGKKKSKSTDWKLSG